MTEITQFIFGQPLRSARRAHLEGRTGAGAVSKRNIANLCPRLPRLASARKLAAPSRIVAPIVHASRMGQFAPTMVEAANETAERWAALPSGAPIDALREMATLTAEIICRTVFGPRLGSEHATAIVASFSEYQRLIGQLDLPYLLGLPDWVPRFYSPAVRRAARRIHEVLDHIIAQCAS